jgi:aspartyl/asparaginyl-tRNA synthetase
MIRIEDSKFCFITISTDNIEIKIMILSNYVDEKIKIIEAFIKDRPLVTITYFIPDKNKNGGKYETITGNVRVIDKVKQVIILSDKSKIDINKILDIRSNILNGMV